MHCKVCGNQMIEVITRQHEGYKEEAWFCESCKNTVLKDVWKNCSTCGGGEADCICGDVDEIYCPRCGSCGEDLCCPPELCVEVQEGLYCDYNKMSYREAMDKIEFLYKAIKEYKEAYEMAEKCLSMILSSGTTEEAAKLMENLAEARANLFQAAEVIW